jgi:hypothetical protein
VVTITPIDDGVGASTFGNWLSGLDPVWVPVLTIADDTYEAFEARERVGISITQSLARMWGSNEDLKLVQKISGEVTPITVIESNQVVILSNNLTPGATLSTENSVAVLVAPTF